MKTNKMLLICAAALSALMIFVNPLNIAGKAAIVSTGLNMPGALPVILNTKSENSESVSVKTEKTAAKAVSDSGTQSKKSDDLTKTPGDIAALMASFAEKHKNDKKDGNIVSMTYTKKNATSTYGNVSIRNSTETKSVNIEKLLNEGTTLHKGDLSKPTVLIYHTHTTEGFEMIERDWYASDWSSRSSDKAVNMVRVGNEIEEQLKKAEIGVIHDTEIYDTTYSGAYDRSRAGMEKALEKYPSIQITLDVHRDAIHESDGDKIKPVAEINGKKAAQVMIITGAEEGRIDNFPNWEENLRFAVRLQNTAETLFPGLMRPIMFCQRIYNMDVIPNSLLLEFGSDANTLDEAAYSGRMIGRVLAEILGEYNTKG